MGTISNLRDTIKSSMMSMGEPKSISIEEELMLNSLHLTMKGIIVTLMEGGSNHSTDKTIGIFYEYEGLSNIFDTIIIIVFCCYKIGSN
jgi:hypothetical protein